MNQNRRKPDFENLLRVLRREKPTRPTLFEFGLNGRLFEKANGGPCAPGGGAMGWWRFVVQGFRNLGYDYAMVRSSQFGFPRGERRHESSVSLNEGARISDRASFDAYPWPDPFAFDLSIVDQLQGDLPTGFKLVIQGPGGVLENVIELVGFDNLCLMLADDRQLVGDLFEAVGSRLVGYYRQCAPHPAVGACVSNDDWGFKTQTMLSTDDLRRYVFPWHQRIVEAIHAGGKPAILHSCGNLIAVFDDIIDVMKYDGKHSYEDTILPVEEAYRRWGKRIAIIGGIDVDFLCRSSIDDIRRRARNLVELSADNGSYALGSGNSIPNYVPDESYFAMTSAALED